MTIRNGPMAVLGIYRSKSRPDKTYSVLLGEDEVIYCECPPWRFQPGVPSKDRSPCQHIKRMKSGDKGELQ